MCWSALGMLWGTTRASAASAVCSCWWSGAEPALGAAAGLGRWFVGVTVLLVCVGFQMTRRRSTTAARSRALPVCDWPALGTIKDTGRSNAAFEVCGWCGGDNTGCCNRAGHQVVCGCCDFAGLCRFSNDDRAPLVNHSAQSPASVWVARPGHAMGHCKLKCSLCSVQEVWWSLHWVLR